MSTTMTNDQEGRLRDWLAFDSGISSEVILEVMTGRLRSGGWRPSTPRDPADFGRCYRLLQIFPEWVERLPEVAQAHPHWGPLVERWDECTRLWEEEHPSGSCPKLYELIQKLRSNGGAA